MNRTSLVVLLACLLGIPLGIGAFTFVYAKGFSYLSPDPRACVNCHIMPIVNQPSLFDGPDRVSGSAFGLGDINPTLFFSPSRPGHFIWGVGPTFTLPTATDWRLGSGKFSLGPAAVGLFMEHRSRIAEAHHVVLPSAGDLSDARDHHLGRQGGARVEAA